MPSGTPEPERPFVVLGVSGGIAAYKTVELVRRLRDQDYHVAVVVTAAGEQFVSPLALGTLASEPVVRELFRPEGGPIPHTRLGRLADIVVVAPATADLLGRYAAGLANDVLTATLLATSAPVLVCPAMHQEMWEHPAVQENVATLRRRGVHVLEPERGALAGGDEGAGRLPEVAVIVDEVATILEGHAQTLVGRRILVTAGGTREAIDPVRVLTNRSSGRQGHALAEVAARWGAQVTLVTASELPVRDHAGRIALVRVASAAAMRQAVLEHLDDSDVLVMAAAVSDFTVSAAPTKLKRRDGVPELHLEPTADILAEAVAHRRPGQVIVGFAAESSDALANAREKLRDKRVDLLVLNDVSRPGAGFDVSTNEVVLLDSAGEQTLSQRSKDEVAQAVLARVASLLSRGDA